MQAENGRDAIQNRDPSLDDETLPHDEQTDLVTTG
jgi:hypothetical protein